MFIPAGALRLHFAGLFAAFQVLLGPVELELQRLEAVFLGVHQALLGVYLLLQLLGFLGLLGHVRVAGVHTADVV